MRIIYLHQYFNTPEMQGGTRSFEMARRLVKAGHAVHMVTSKRDADDHAGPVWEESEETGIHVHWCRVPYSNRMSFTQRIQAFARYAWLAGKRAASLPADVVFATSTPLTVAGPAVRVARKLRVPMVFEVRDLWPDVPIALGVLRNPILKASARWLERYAYRHATRIVALSPEMKKGVVRKGYPTERPGISGMAAIASCEKVLLLRYHP